MNILKVNRLSKKISTGLVIKILLETKPEEVEHSIHILFFGSILNHSHPDSEGITEGYREWNLKSGNPSSWEWVGAGQHKKSHGIPYKDGIRIVEGIKRRLAPESSD